jgi:hypothetical protein
MPHVRHFPRSQKKLTSGIRSWGAKTCPQWSQADLASTTSRPCGQRRTKTPSQLPMAGATSNTIQPGISI